MLEATATRADLDYLLDTTAINKKMADRKDNPFRWRVGSFMMPLDASKGHQKAICHNAAQVFVTQQVREGWVQASKLQFWKEKPIAHDLLSGAYLLDREEWRVRGIFRKEDFKPVRIEVNPAIIRQSPDQTMNLSEAIKAYGLNPSDIKDVSRNGKRAEILTRRS